MIKTLKEELKFDILDDESLSSQDLNSTIQNLDSKYISAELELDINTEGLSSQNSSSTIQNFSTSSKKRRNKVGTHDESGNYKSNNVFLRFVSNAILKVTSLGSRNRAKS
ncbi:unnamed protein product [Rhizophagus irregularis]|nr:unnamed protein product [Rhizophagus irregularis]